MAITLTTPHSFDPGHSSAVQSFSQVKIVRVFQDAIEELIVMSLQYGDTIAGDWIGSVDMPIHEETIYNYEGMVDGEGGWTELPSPDYDLFLVSQFASSTSTFLYDEVSASLEQYLVDDGRYVGSVESPVVP